MKQHEPVVVRGLIDFMCSPKTLGDVRAYLALLDKYNLPDETAIAEGYLHVELSGKVDPIQCGCEIPGKPREWYMDALVQLHDCEEE